MTDHLSRISKLSLLGLCLILPGCGGSAGPKLGQVAGVVRFDGQPVSGLTVFFESTSGTTSAGGTNEAGQYRLSFPGNRTGAELGHHVVRIVGRDPQLSDKDLEGVAGERGVPVEELKKTPIIPAKYNEKTELSAEVKSGRNEIDFDLMP